MESYKLANSYDKTNDEMTRYWTDGENAFFKNSEIKKVDVESFVQYPSYIGYAKDKNNVYIKEKIFKEADVDTFEVLNYAYAKDKINVWTMIGNIENVDAKTFEACDDGKHFNGETKINGKLHKTFIPYSFGKDKNNVYYYDTVGKVKIVKNAVSKTFVSLNDGYFVYDEQSVFLHIIN